MMFNLLLPFIWLQFSPRRALLGRLLSSPSSGFWAAFMPILQGLLSIWLTNITNFSIKVSHDQLPSNVLQKGCIKCTRWVCKSSVSKVWRVEEDNERVKGPTAEKVFPIALVSTDCCNKRDLLAQTEIHFTVLETWSQNCIAIGALRRLWSYFEGGHFLPVHLPYLVGFESET